MLVKVGLIFLLGMALLAMVGSALLKASGIKPKYPKIAKPFNCPQCGQRDVAGAVLGRKSCRCGTK
jgi:hypothetical protein